MIIVYRVYFNFYHSFSRTCAACQTLRYSVSIYFLLVDIRFRFTVFGQGLGSIHVFCEWLSVRPRLSFLGKLRNWPGVSFFPFKKKNCNIDVPSGVGHHH